MHTPTLSQLELDRFIGTEAHPPAVIERFFHFERELENALTVGKFHESPETRAARDTLAIVRGRLELARDYGTGVDLRHIESALAHAASLFGLSTWRRPFLRRLRTAAAWARIGPMVPGA